MKNFKLKQVLVPLNFTRNSYNALDTAIAVCQKQGSSLTLMNVVSNTRVIIPPKREAIVVPVVQLTRLASENLNALCQSLKSKYELNIDYVVEAGVPAHAICSYAEKNKFDLVVMGSKSNYGFHRRFMDSTIYNVVKASPCPVLTVPPTRLFTKFNKVVYPVRNVPLMLDKYQIIKPMLSSDESILMLAGLMKENDNEGFRRVRVNMNVLRRKLRNDGVENSTRVDFCENISDRLLEISNREQPDLIVIIAKIQNSIRRIFIERFARNIVGKAPCPVLSIRPDMSVIN